MDFPSEKSIGCIEECSSGKNISRSFKITHDSHNLLVTDKGNVKNKDKDHFIDDLTVLSRRQKVTIC